MQALLNNIYIYRLWRLRRLILLAILLPLASVLALAAAGYSGPLSSAGVGLWLTGLWAMLALTQRYPRAPLGHLAFALATAGLILLFPLGDWLLAQVKGATEARHTLGLIALGFVAWLSIGMGFEAALEWAVRNGKPRSFRIRTTWRSTLPPDEILPLMMPQPGITTPLRRFGPHESDGRFAVWETALGETTAPSSGPSSGPWGKPETRAADYWVISVTQTDSTSFTALYATPEGGTEALVLTAWPDGSGSILCQDSQSNVMTLVGRVFDYLADISTDIAVAETDLIEGRTQVRANCLQPLDYPGKAWVERMKAQENTPPLF